ncbi:DUF4407 domain-containing protein [Actinomadura rugatobispora]|uniref:DUF4407 domain-containing protein n=1 Tax=Actinomadura rugatobispora TaxID=1994 RepID=A0ABW0ZZT1_9ACTN
MKNPLIWLSGADPQILRNASTDRAKYIGIGGAVLTTAGLATLSMFFAMRMAMGAPVWAAILLSLVWFLVILNLDRWLVVSLQRSDRKMHTLMLAVPRVLMALLFGVIISTPLVLQVFDAEVEVAVKELQGDASRDFQQELVNGPDGRRIKELEAQEAKLLAQRSGNGLVNPEDDPEIKQLRASLPALQKEYKENDDKATCELTGERCTDTSGRSGSGPRFQKFDKRRNDLRRQIDQINQQIEDKAKALRTEATQNKEVLQGQAARALPGVQGELKTLRDRQQERRAAFEERNSDNGGLLIRLKALDRASEGESQLMWARLLLFLFITVLECLPIIVKVLQLFGPPGAYDDAVSRHRAKDRLLLQDQIRKQQGVGLRENSEHIAYSQMLERRRAEMRQDLVERTIEAETRVHQAELERWEREQMRQVTQGDHGGQAHYGQPYDGGGPWGGGGALPGGRDPWGGQGAQPGAPGGPGGPVQDPKGHWGSPPPPPGEPIQARIIRGIGSNNNGGNGSGGNAGTTRDDLRFYPDRRDEDGGWFRRRFGRGRRRR